MRKEGRDEREYRRRRTCRTHLYTNTPTSEEATVRNLGRMLQNLFCSNIGCVTRFGEISPFGQNLQSLGKLFEVFFAIWEILDQCGKILYVIGQVLIDANGQMLKNNIAIWSHWKQVCKKLCLNFESLFWGALWVCPWAYLHQLKRS